MKKEPKGILKHPNEHKHENHVKFDEEQIEEYDKTRG